MDLVRLGLRGGGGVTVSDGVRADLLLGDHHGRGEGRGGGVHGKERVGDGALRQRDPRLHGGRKVSAEAAAKGQLLQPGVGPAEPERELLLRDQAAMIGVSVKRIISHSKR